MIPVFKPWIDENEISSAVSSLENGWLGMGSYVGDFEKQLEKINTTQDNPIFAVAVSTGHAALHLALLDIGLQEGDEVITPSFNNIADFQAILATGAQPVFCDIDPINLCIDINSVKRMITERTKAIIIMDYAYHLCNYNDFKDLEKQSGIKIIHDAAHSFGGFYKGNRVGGIFDYTMYSFDPVKNITCIDGGALLVKSMETQKRLREMRLIGMGQPADVMYTNARAWTYDVKRLGFRYHMANLHAAIGLAQLAKLDDIYQSRSQSFLYYVNNLQNLKNIKIPNVNHSDSKPLPFIFYLRVPGEKRNIFMNFMKEKGIDTGIHWQAGHKFTLFQNCKRDELTITEKIAEEIVTIPFHSKMKSEIQDFIVNAIKDFDILITDPAIPQV